MEGSFGLRKACTLCRQAHVGCEGCVASGMGDQCVFLPSRKRGRPHKSTAPSAAPVPLLAATATSHSRPTMAKRLQVDGSYAVPPPMTSALPPLAIRPVLLQPPSIAPIAATHDPIRLSTSTAPTATVQSHRLQSGAGMAASDVKQQQQQESIQDSALSLVLAELRDLRRDNQHLIKGMRKLNARQKKFKLRISSVEEENQHLLSLAVGGEYESATLRMRLPQGPFSQPIDPSSSGYAYPPRLSAIKQLLPFLEMYDLQTVPIDDLSKPFAAFVKGDPDDYPNFVYASPSYCRVFGYEQRELMSLDLGPLCHPSDHATCDIVEYYAMLCLQAFTGPVYHTTPIMLTKTGRMLRVLSRSQFYFSSSGQAKWVITTIDAILPEDAGVNLHRPALTHGPVQTPPSSSNAYPPVSPLSGFSGNSSQTTPSSTNLGEWETDQATDDLEELLQALHEP